MPSRSPPHPCGVPTSTILFCLCFFHVPFKHPMPIIPSLASAGPKNPMALQVPEMQVVDAMDELWFRQNILLCEPDVVRLRSRLTVPKNVPPSDETTENGRRPERLNIAMGQPQFQLQSKARGKLRSHSSSPSISTGSHPKGSSSSKRKGGERSYKSLSELENYELKGFLDLGFTFPKDKLSAYMMSMVPGLQRLQEKDEGTGQRRVTRPYLSEAWVFGSPNSPLINLQMLRRTRDGDDVKKHIKFWARKVAMLVNEEP